MPTSKSADYNETQSEIVTDALVEIGAIEQGEAAAPEDYTSAVRKLNRMVKAWQADQIHLWTREEVYLFLQKGQSRYQIGGASGAHFASVDDTVRMTLAADFTAPSDTVVVDDATGVVAGDSFGLVLDGETIEWGVVQAVVTNTITLAAPLTQGNATAGQPAFSYTTKLGRALRIISIQRTNTADIDTPIYMIAHETYQRLPMKQDEGLPNEAYYQPVIDVGLMDVWPAPNSARNRLRLTALFSIQDFDATTNLPDFPQEWLDALHWNLAVKLMPSYGVPADVKADIKEQAAITLDAALGFDREPESTYFAPGFRWAQ